MLEQRFLVFGLGNIIHENLSDIFRVDFFDVEDDERHECLSGFEDDLVRVFVMRDPE